MRLHSFATTKDGMPQVKHRHSWDNRHADCTLHITRNHMRGSFLVCVCCDHTTPQLPTQPEQLKTQMQKLDEMFSRTCDRRFIISLGRGDGGGGGGIVLEKYWLSS